MKNRDKTVSYASSSQGYEIGTAVPILRPGIGTRISEMCARLGTRKDAAAVAGVSTDTLQRYIREEVQPSFEPLARMAITAGVSMEWLATGEGAMQPDETRDRVLPPSVRRLEEDVDLLQDVIEVTDELLEEHRIRLTPAKRARVYRLLFELCSGDETQAIDRDKVVQLIRLAS